MTDPVPFFIKRNTVLIAVAQVFAGAGGGFTFSLGPLMILALTGSAALTGLAVALLGVSRFLAAYPFGRITDQFGRRPGLLLALSIGLGGTILVGAAMSVGIFALWVAGILIFGVGHNGVQQLRLAAAEMYPPHRRALVIGVVLTGSLGGVVLTPAIVGLGESIAPTLSMDPLAVPWLITPLLILPSMALISRIRPDPREVAAELPRYYPSYVAAEPVPVQGSFGLRRFLAHPERRVAALTMFSAQGSMQIAMVSAPLMLSHHTHSLAAIALSMSIHTAGMFGPSIPVGKLADMIGRRAVLVLGTAVEATGGVITVLAQDQFGITLGIFLVGLGWCGANVASTAIVVDSSPIAVRGRAVGLIDTIAAAAGIAFPLAAGPMIQGWGVISSGILAVVLMIPPAIVLTVSALRTASVRRAAAA